MMSRSGLLLVFLLHITHLAMFIVAFKIPYWRTASASGGHFGLWTCLDLWTDNDDYCSRIWHDVLPAAVLQCIALVLTVLGPAVPVLVTSSTPNTSDSYFRWLSASFPASLALNFVLHVTSLILFAARTSQYGDLLISFKVSSAACAACLVSVAVNGVLWLRGSKHPLVTLGESMRHWCGYRPDPPANYHNGEATRLLPSEDQGSRLVMLGN